MGLKPIDYSAVSLHTPNYDRNTTVAGNSDHISDHSMKANAWCFIDPREYHGREVTQFLDGGLP